MLNDPYVISPNMVRSHLSMGIGSMLGGVIIP